MKILCYGDSNTWGWVPGKLGLERFEPANRWPGVLQASLGAEHEVIEAALGARTTMFDDTRDGFELRSGLALLPITLETFAPVDVVIIMLGTADCKPMFDLSPELIAGGLEQLILASQNFKAINGKTPQKIMIIGPPVIDERAEPAGRVFAGGEAKAEAILPLYKELAAQYDCLYLDSNDYVEVDADEGIHITAESQQKLGQAVAALLSQTILA